MSESGMTENGEALARALVRDERLSQSLRHVAGTYLRVLSRGDATVEELRALERCADAELFERWAAAGGCRSIADVQAMIERSARAVHLLERGAGGALSLDEAEDVVFHARLVGRDEKWEGWRRPVQGGGTLAHFAAWSGFSLSEDPEWEGWGWRDDRGVTVAHAAAHMDCLPPAGPEWDAWWWKDESGWSVAAVALVEGRLPDFGAEWRGWSDAGWGGEPLSGLRERLKSRAEKVHVVLFRENGIDNPAAPPRGMRFRAQSPDHAEEQLRAAHRGREIDVLWIHEGRDVESALQAYWGCGVDEPSLSM